ncbi:hypothetical protein NXS15_03495 [Mycoplasma sp. CSL7475-4]|uniref:MHO_1590 family protein n=1 Tax=Mycoplasma sp. CSL7475-4 TaxID=2973942 RepID=UPI00216AC3B9|nr:hypothetical protein [Mycoplasma sp. CSL7475-4]MCS4537177.1 hypothetical protein [Mycoplasma sp. CSL7475-4]
MNKKKIIIPIASLSAIASITIPIVTVSLTKKNKNKIEEKAEYKINQDEIYPVINKNQFYEYVRYIDNKAVFDKSIVNAVFNYVVANMQTNVDKLEFDYHFIDDGELELKFIAYNANQIFTKSYKLSTKLNLEEQ